MVAAIVTHLKKLSEVPKDVIPAKVYSPQWVRLYVFCSYGYPIGVCIHALLAIVFALIGVKWLAIFNFFCIILWLSAIITHRKGYMWQGFFLISIPVMTHALVCVAVIGWDAGFQYYLIIYTLTVFFSHWATPVKVAIAIMYSCFYAAIQYFISPLPPIITLHPSYITLFQYVNFFMMAFGLSFCGYIFSLATIKAEAKLDKAHQRTNDILKHLNEELSEASDYVKRILPSPISVGTIRTNWRFVPSTSLGGDAFGYHRIDDENLAAYLIDVSGHGVGAALLSISVINVLRSQSLRKTDFKDPGQVLQSLNLAFPSESNKDMFFTMWYGVYNMNSRELTYASGGHPPAILFDDNFASDSKIKLLKTPNYVIGGMPEATYTTEKCTVGEGNTLYVYSDGVYEVEKSDGSMWRFNEFKDYLQQVRTETGSVLDSLYEHVKELGNSDTLEDDFTILEVAFT